MMNVSGARSLFDKYYSRILVNPKVEIVHELIQELNAIYDDGCRSGKIEEIKSQALEHPIANLVLEDPYTARARHKPRGYAGDAVLLDYIYMPDQKEIDQLRDVGKAVFSATTAGGNGKSVLWRQQHLAEKISQKTNRSDLKILSVACGHMRELSKINQKTLRDIEIYGLDQDNDSLLEVKKSYKSFPIVCLNNTIIDILRNKIDLPKFDLIYSAGLFDYLKQPVAKKLVSRLCPMLKDTGELVIGNFTPESDGRGFMAILMEWELEWRSKSELLSLFDGMEKVNLSYYLDQSGNVGYVAAKGFGASPE